MPSFSAVSATSAPIAPSPTTPSVRCGSSMPANCFLPSSTRASKSLASTGISATNFSAGTRLRAPISSAASTSSLTALAFAPGALNTGSPRFDISATGMLLVPAPARPIALTLAGTVIECMSWERTRIASRSSGNRSRPCGEMLLSVRIWNRDMSVTSVDGAGPLGRGLSAVAALELAQIVDQRLHAFDRHRVVDRRAHAADRAVPLELQQAALLCAFEEGSVERLVAELERHVHARAIFPRNRVRVEAARIDRVVQQLCLGDVLLLDRGQPALREQPFEHHAGDVNRVGRRRVQHRVRLGLFLPVEGRWRDRQRAVEQVLADDDERQSYRTDILL